MSLIYGADEYVSKWVAERIPHVTTFGPCSAIGVASGDRLIAGMVYHDFQPDFGTIQLSMAADSPMWARPETCKGLLEYPFEQLDCFKVWTATPIDGEAALKVNLHVGFKKEAVLAHHFGRKRHGVVCRMLKPDYVRRFCA